MFDDPEISDDDDTQFSTNERGGLGSGPGMSRQNFSSGHLNLNEVGLESPPGRDSPTGQTNQYSGYPAPTNMYTGSTAPSLYMNNPVPPITTSAPSRDIRYGDTERDLAKDAQWKMTQNYTFSRWINAQLKPTGMQVRDITTDLSDGLALIALLETLAGAQFRMVQRRPDLRQQKIENVTLALDFLEQHEDLKLINIHAVDIVDGNSKIIMALVWQLILHFAIIKHTQQWEGTERLQSSLHASPSHDESGGSASEWLLAWINMKLESQEVSVKNFVRDWNDGIALGALVNVLAPACCTDWRRWDPEDGLQNVTKAMAAADQWLEIPQLVRPEEVIRRDLDERAMLTYLSEFPNSRFRAGKVHMMPPPVNFEPTRVPTVDLDADQFDAARVTFADQMAAPPMRSAQSPNYAPSPAQKIYAPPVQMSKLAPVQAAQPPAPPPRELPPPAAPLQLNIPDKGTYGTIQQTFNEKLRHIDIYATSVTMVEYGSFRDLIWALIYSRNLKDDLEKLRAIYLWLCTKDLGKMTFKDQNAPDSPESMLLGLKNNKTTYAEAFDLLCGHAGLKCAVVSGYVKAVGYEPGMKFAPGANAFRHSWNAVNVYNQWYLVDCDWSARYYTSKDLRVENLRYTLNTFYFLTEPSRFIFTHLPDEAKWQLLDTPITLEEFEQLPFVKSFFFKYELEIISHPCAVLQTEHDCLIQFRVPERFTRCLVFSAKLFYDSTVPHMGSYTRSSDELGNYAIVMIEEDVVSVRVRFPEPAVYRLILYARVLAERVPDIDERARVHIDSQYHDFCKYQIAATNFQAQQALQPFPPSQCRRFGLHTDSPLRDFVSHYEVLRAASRQPLAASLAMPSTSPLVETDSGACEIRLILTRPIAVRAVFRTYLRTQLDRIAEVKQVGPNEVQVHVVLPESGEYTLELYGQPLGGPALALPSSRVSTFVPADMGPNFHPLAQLFFVNIASQI